MIRVVVADDQPLVRAGFAMILDAEPDLDVVGEASDGAEAVALVASTHPHVVLMDIRMPGTDGIEATRRITASGAEARVIALTTFDLDEYVFEVLRAGASGFLLKDVPADRLVDAVRTVARGEAVIAPSITRRLIDRFATRLPSAPADVAGVDRLTERERDVLRLLARGCSNAEIADALDVAETTVKTHIGRILMKLGVRDRVQAVVYAYEHGVVEPGQS